jgi:predicted AAA+ superfamily ATPase
VSLPRIYDSAQPQRLLNAYVGEYLKEEVMAEGLVRNLPPFSEFLNSAALGDTEQVNFTNIARELGVSRETVRGYYQILEDTLLYAERFARFAFWRLSTGVEVDFIVNQSAGKLTTESRSCRWRII